MLRLKRIVERKQVGNLYHVCSTDALVYNLKNNSITPGRASNTRKGKKVISLTRNKNYIVDTISFEDIVFFQIVLDGDKISDSHRIEPYADTMYRDPEEQEQEEIVYGNINNLDTVLKSVTVYIDCTAILSGFSRGRFSIKKSVLDALNILQKYNTQVSIAPIVSRVKLEKIRTSLPTTLEGLISLFNKVNTYNTESMFSAILSLCERFFKDKGSIKTVKAGRFLSIQVLLNKDTKITSVKNEIQILVDTIKEELDSKGILVLQSKAIDKPFSRHEDTKLNSILNNRTYLIKSFLINPCFDYLSNTCPYATLELLNASGKELTFTTYFK